MKAWGEASKHGGFDVSKNYTAGGKRSATKVFMASREKIIPANESVPLKGSIFRDWEDQVEVLVQQVVPTLLEERSVREPAGIARTVDRRRP